MIIIYIYIYICECANAMGVESIIRLNHGQHNSPTGQ